MRYDDIRKGYYCPKSSGRTQLAVLLAFPSSSLSPWKTNVLPGTGAAVPQNDRPGAAEQKACEEGALAILIENLH